MNHSRRNFLRTAGLGAEATHGQMLGHGEPVRAKERERVLFHILNGSARRFGVWRCPATHSRLLCSMAILFHCYQQLHMDVGFVTLFDYVQETNGR